MVDAFVVEGSIESVGVIPLCCAQSTESPLKTQRKISSCMRKQRGSDDCKDRYYQTGVLIRVLFEEMWGATNDEKVWLSKSPRCQP